MNCKKWDTKHSKHRKRDSGHKKKRKKYSPQETKQVKAFKKQEKESTQAFINEKQAQQDQIVAAYNKKVSELEETIEKSRAEDTKLTFVVNL